MSAGGGRSDGGEGVPAGRTEVVLDVRDLPPPEPMALTLERLQTLRDDEVLVHVNSREPIYLLPILGERGYRYAVEQRAPGLFHVRIWRAGA